MPRGIERIANARDVAGHAGCRLVVANQDGFDFVLLVVLQPLCVDVDRNALAPFDIDNVDDQTMAAAEISPQVRKLAKDRDQYSVAGRQGISNRRLPSPGSRTRKQEDLPLLRLKDSLEIAKQWERERGNIRCALIFQPNVH